MTTLSELGAYLQRHREERGWSLDEAEEITHIRRHYIEAMEAGDWDNLPPAVYTRGLLRNYARSLGVSQASIMRMHAKERPHEARLPEPQLISQPLVVTSRFSFELIAAIALLLISAGMIAWVVRSQLPGVLQSAQQASDSNRVTVAQVVPTETPTPKGPTDTPAPTRELRRTAAVVTADTDSAGSAAADGTAGAGDRTPEAPNGTGRAGDAAPDTGDGTPARSGTTGDTADEGTAAPQPSGTAARGAAAATTRASGTAEPSATATIRVAGTRLVMDITATSDAWIQVYTDGEVAFRDFLRKGQRKRWSAKERMGLRTGNAGGTGVQLNGQELEPLGGNGEVVEYEWRMLPSGDVEQRKL